MILEAASPRNNLLEIICTSEKNFFFRLLTLLFRNITKARLLYLRALASALLKNLVFNRLKVTLSTITHYFTTLSLSKVATTTPHNTPPPLKHNPPSPNHHHKSKKNPNQIKTHYKT